MEHFTARKSWQNNNLDPDFDSIKIEQGLGVSRSSITDLRRLLNGGQVAAGF